MNLLSSRFLIVIVFVVTGIAAVIYFNRPAPVPVSIYTVEKGTVVKTVANTRVGTVKACRRSYLAPTIPGNVAVLNVKEGDAVTTNAVLLEIWNEDLRAELKLAEAKKTAARAQSREACATADGARREYDRLKRLQKDKLISEERIDFAYTDAEAKQAACTAAKAAIDVSDEQIGVARSALERTIIRAPYDGVVAEVNAEVGEYVTPSPQGIQTPPTIDLLDLSCVYVSAPIDEVDAPPITPGMHACVKLDAFPHRVCNGTVRRIAPYVMDLEKQARTIEVEVELSEPADMKDLLAGYSADVEIELDIRKNVLRIPTEAILQDNLVLVFDTDGGKLVERQIKRGLSNWNYTEVLSGLHTGEKVVVSTGHEGVVAGARAIIEGSYKSRHTP